MINQSERQTKANIDAVEARIDVRLAQLPTREFLSKLAREAKLWLIGTVIAVLGLLFTFMMYGRDQFEAGIQITTGTINYHIEAKKAQEEAKKAHEESTRKFDQVLEFMSKQRRQDEPPAGSK